MWNAPAGPIGNGQGDGSEEVRVVRRIEETNEAIRACLEGRRRQRLTGVVGFIGPLPRPIGLLDDEVREGRRVWALPSPFLVLSHLQQHYLEMWEH